MGRLILAPMEGLADCVLRDALTRIGGFDEAVSEFVRVSGSLLPERTFRRFCPELATAPVRRPARRSSSSFWAATRTGWRSTRRVWPGLRPQASTSILVVRRRPSIVTAVAPCCSMTRH